MTLRCMGDTILSTARDDRKWKATFVYEESGQEWAKAKDSSRSCVREILEF